MILFKKLYCCFNFLDYLNCYKQKKNYSISSTNTNYEENYNLEEVFLEGYKLF